MLKIIVTAALIVSGIFCFQNLTQAQNDPAGDVKEEKTTDSKDESTVGSLETKKESSDQPEGLKMEDGILYGKNYDTGVEAVEFSALMNNPSDYTGKTILITGNVSEVCQKMGCWLVLSDGSKSARVTTLHSFFVPKDVSGSQAVVFGKFIETELSEDMAKHYNEESNNPKNEDEIKGPEKVYEIEADGVKILFNSDKN